MSKLLLVLLPFSLIVTAESQTVFLCGMLNQSDGMAVVHVINGKASELVRFNELRPSAHDEDWTRSFIGLRPVMILEDYLYYYIPSNSTSTGHGGVLLRRKAGTAPEVVCETPLLENLCKRPGAPQIVFVTKDHQIAILDVVTHSNRLFNLSREFAFASWTSDGKAIVASTSQNAEIVSIDEQSGRINMDQLIDKRGTIRRVYAMTNGVDYIMQYGADICIFNSNLKSLRIVKSSRIRSASDLLYCESNGVTYVLVPNDNDGRELVILDPETGKARRIANGVFDDEMIDD